MSDDVQEEEHCYQVALPATDAPMTVGRLTDLLLRERAAIRAELSHELEVERLRLAACGIAARGCDDECFADMKIEYNSDALQATRRLRDERDALKAERDQFIADIASLQRVSEQQTLWLHKSAERERRFVADFTSLREELAELQFNHDRYRELHREWVQVNEAQLTELREAAEAVERCCARYPEPEPLTEFAGLVRQLRAVLAKVKP